MFSLLISAICTVAKQMYVEGIPLEIQTRHEQQYKHVHTVLLVTATIPTLHIIIGEYSIDDTIIFDNKKYNT